mgnify:CR=1 FL=1
MKILLVEDDKDLSKALGKILVINKYDVDYAYDGLMALDFLNYSSYDLIIMDIMMPNMDGLTAIKQIRNIKNMTPILVLTAKSMLSDKIEGLDSGADDYLTKPFQMAELLARIRALTRRSKSIPSLEIGNIKLLEGDYTIKAIKSIKLTNKEYKLMELLIHNKNVYLNSERILETIWDIDDDVDVNVLFVFISNLRKKLEQIGANYTIKSKRGIGYRLEEKWKN